IDRHVTASRRSTADRGGAVGRRRRSASGDHLLKDSIMAGLIIRTPDGKLRSTRLVKPLTSIGRSEDNDIRLEHPSVAESAVHIHYDGSAYRVGSHGGTFQVNGKRRDEHVLAQDDQLRIGDCELFFDASLGEAAAQPEHPAGSETAARLKALRQLT